MVDFHGSGAYESYMAIMLSLSLPLRPGHQAVLDSALARLFASTSALHAAIVACQQSATATAKRTAIAEARAALAAAEQEHESFAEVLEAIIATAAQDQPIDVAAARTSARQMLDQVRRGIAAERAKLDALDEALRGASGPVGRA